MEQFEFLTICLFSYLKFGKFGVWKCLYCKVIVLQWNFNSFFFLWLFLKMFIILLIELKILYSKLTVSKEKLKFSKICLEFHLNIYIPNNGFWCKFKFEHLLVGSFLKMFTISKEKLLKFFFWSFIVKFYFLSFQKFLYFKFTVFESNSNLNGFSINFISFFLRIKNFKNFLHLFRI